MTGAEHIIQATKGQSHNRFFKEVTRKTKQFMAHFPHFDKNVTKKQTSIFNQTNMVNIERLQ